MGISTICSRERAPKQLQCVCTFDASHNKHENSEKIFTILEDVKVSIKSGPCNTNRQESNIYAFIVIQNSQRFFNVLFGLF